jgi:hypothetical protein
MSNAKENFSTNKK